MSTMDTSEFVKLTRDAIKELIRARTEALPQPPNHERRRAPRWPFPAMVEIYMAGDDSGRWFATCHNMSETGLGMSCEQYFEPETRLEIAIHLPEATFCGHGIVRYAMKTPRGQMTGVEFDFPS